MIDYEKVGKQIALLRKEKKLTGEKLAEVLNVSPQAVSKWENGKCLPETALLPQLAKALGCSIDSLLMPKELLVLEALYTDGQTSVNVTQQVNSLVINNRLSLCVNSQLMGAPPIDSQRLKLLTVKYQSPAGIYFTFALQNQTVEIDLSENADTKAAQRKSCPAIAKGFKLLGAFYGNEKAFASAMQKMEHYEYFKWSEINVNHEIFPSSTASDEAEYLTLVYLNEDGIHVISCAENDTLYYSENRTSLFLKDSTSRILPGIIRLAWEEGMDCPWAGALYASLKYMGEGYSYQQIMGLSGACYRLSFVDVWDWSCTDALVAFDYSTILFNAIGYEQVWADRLEKSDRKAERQAIVRDIQCDKPVIAINLRVAPEWGVITGYLDNGNVFLCRTYFDKGVLEELEKDEKNEDSRLTFNERGGYLVNDFWPFMIVHFGEKKQKPSDTDCLRTSLKALIDSYNAPQTRGYYQGRGAYEAWIRGLQDENAFGGDDKEGIVRRLGVNDNMLLCLIDARRCAETYLRECVSLISCSEQPLLIQIADNFSTMHKMLSNFKQKVNFDYNQEITYNTMKTNGVSTPDLRQEQIELLRQVMELEEENFKVAEKLLSN